MTLPAFTLSEAEAAIRSMLDRIDRAKVDRVDGIVLNGRAQTLRRTLGWTRVAPEELLRPQLERSRPRRRDRRLRTHPCSIREEEGRLMSKIADILDKAADLIEPEGVWSWFDLGGTGDLCAYLAIGEAVGDNDRERLLYCAAAAFAKQIGVTGREGIWEWNDAPERTQAEVVSALREAAAKARSEHA